MLEKLKNRKAAGFTLLELIVVLLILGVLAAVAVPTFQTVRENSADRSAVTTAEAIARNANAIAASEDGGDAVDGHLYASANEAGIGAANGRTVSTAIANADATGILGTVTVQVDSGSYSTCSTVSISGDLAVASAASGSAC